VSLPDGSEVKVMLLDLVVTRGTLLAVSI